MKKISDPLGICIYILTLASFLVVSLLGNRAITVFSENLELPRCVIIDAGHGGIDSGAVSCTGVYESHINLQIALKLQDLLHLLGVKTIMIRDTDCSIDTEGNTIAAKKISDIRERIRIINSTPNAILISIHQNYYKDQRYSGAQIFHNTIEESKVLAEKIQGALRTNLDPGNKRSVKKISGVYLMEQIHTPGVLIECGFLSNPAEEAKLRDNQYQNKMCSVISTALSQYLNT